MTVIVVLIHQHNSQFYLRNKNDSKQQTEAFVFPLKWIGLEN